MTKKGDLPYVNQWIEKPSGILRRKYRRGSFSRMLPNDCEMSAPKFLMAYARAQAAYEERRGKKKGAPVGDALEAVAARYLLSAHFDALAPTTKTTKRQWFKAFCADYGDLPFVEIQTRNVMSLMEKRAIAGQRFAANRIPEYLGALWNWCALFDDRFQARNPFANIKKYSQKTDGYHTWTDAERETFEAHFPSGSMPRLAYALLYYTASRRSEVFQLGRQHIDNGFIRVRREKTDDVAEIWMHAELWREIEQTPTDRLTFIVSEIGKPFETANGFGRWFRRQCLRAGLERCTPHGLRKAFTTGAAERGDSDAQIAAVTSHRSPAVLAHYRAKANQRKMAKDAVKKWESGE